MKILIISDQFLHGGLEEQIVNHVNTLKNSTQFCFAFAKYENRQFFNDYNVYDKIKCDPEMTIYDVINDVNEICSIIQKESVDVIEVHPFYAFLPAMIAANRCNVPIIHILHGAPSIVFDKRINTLALHRFFLTEFASIIITPNRLFDHALQKQYGVKQLLFVPNTIEVCKYSGIKYNPEGKFALFSRLDEDKTIQVKKAIDCAKQLNIQVDIYGNGSQINIIKKHISNTKMEKTVKLIGWTDNVPQTLKNNDYAGVIGGSRVALEGLASNLPTLLIGWDKVSGFIDKQTYNKIKNFNISNRSLCEINQNELKRQFQILQRNPSEYRLRKLVEKDFDNCILLNTFPEAFNQAIKNFNYYNMLDVIYERLLKTPNLDKKTSFFDSSIVSVLLEEIFTSQFVVNPLVIDLFLTQSLKRKNEELTTLLNDNSIYTQSRIDDIMLRLSALENKKSTFKKGTDKLAHVVKRLIK